MLGLTWLGMDWLEWTDLEWTDLEWTVLSVVVEHVGGCRPGFWKFGLGLHGNSGDKWQFEQFGLAGSGCTG